jgi:hypothetical protein
MLEQPFRPTLPFSQLVGILEPKLLLSLINLPCLLFSNRHGASYLTTITNTATGMFASRGMFTFHADSTMSAIDSGQGGPTFFFSSQLGSWKPDGEGGLIARTIDFDFPPNADVGRLDYTVKFSADGTQVSGTITFTTFPLQSNPLDGGGTVAGQFTFIGTLVTP